MRLDRVARVYRLRERIAAVAHAQAVARERLAQDDVELVDARATLIDERRTAALAAGSGPGLLQTLEQADAALALMQVAVERELDDCRADTRQRAQAVAERQQSANHVDELARQQRETLERVRELREQDAAASLRTIGAVGCPA